MEESFKYHIPEDIPANERTAFHGAAAAAARDGKKNFSFGGKTHPVTMKKDTAKAIADQKESVGKTAGDHGYYHLQKAKELAKKDGHDYDKLPQYDRTHDKHKDHYDSRAKKESVKKESTMTFREKLMSLYEGDRASHYKGATKPEEYDEKQKSSKGAMDMMKTPKSVEADGMKAAKDTAAAIKKSAPGKKMRKGDQNKGDLSIKPSATPVKDPSAKIITAEEYGMFGKKISDNLLDAIAMVEDMDKKMTVDIDHDTGTTGSHEKKHGITLKKSKNYDNRRGMMSTFASGKKRDLQKYLKKHYDGDHKTMHPEIYKESVSQVTERKRTISTKKVKGDRSMHDQHAKTGYGMGGEQTYAAANNMKQTHYSKYISKKSGHESYFDGKDLVHAKSSKTVVPNALHGKHTPDQLADKMKAHGDKHKG